mgnify:CR=1 FL=1
MGTPEFAVAVLDRILAAGHEVPGVVTTPDKPAGRGQRTRFSNVKSYALEHNLLLMQPEKLRDEAFLEQLRRLRADVFVVVAFRMLPKAVYAMPPMGTFNVHASLLPQYRGAAPIQWAVINGETRTGVTTFLLDEHTDTGAILRQTAVDIAPNDTAGTLHDKLMRAGADIAAETLRDMESGNCTPRPQPSPAGLKPAPKIFKEDTLINWDDTAENIRNKVRGLSPHPAAYSRITRTGDEPRTLTLKILACSITGTKSSRKPGEITIVGEKHLLVSTKNNDISVDILQLEGKKQLETAFFLQGFRKDNYILKLF